MNHFVLFRAALFRAAVFRAVLFSTDLKQPVAGAEIRIRQHQSWIQSITTGTTNGFTQRG